MSCPGQLKRGRKRTQGSIFFCLDEECKISEEVKEEKKLELHCIGKLRYARRERAKEVELLDVFVFASLNLKKRKTRIALV